VTLVDEGRPKEKRIPKDLWPIFIVFFAEAFVLGNWITRIPDVKDLFELSASELGLNLFIFAGGTLVAFVFGSRIIKRVGVGIGCAWSVPAWAISMALVPHMPNAYALAILFVLSGINIGMLEIAMNTAADEWERKNSARCMSRAHGFWSVGSLVGALTGTFFAWLGASVAIHFAIVMPIITIIGVVAALKIPKNTKVQLSATDDRSFKLPSKSIILLCLMPIGIMLIEGAFIDWSALFLRDELKAGPIAVGLIFSAFALLMSITRLNGDWLLDRFGPVRVARVSAMSAILGISLFAFAPNVYVAFIGAFFSGLGVAIVYPLAMAAAAKKPGDAEDNVAAMSLFSFTAFMLAPPLIGFVADATDLRIALALLIPVAATSLLLTDELKEGTPHDQAD
jgi:MFS family permease